MEDIVLYKNTKNTGNRKEYFRKHSKNLFLSILFALSVAQLNVILMILLIIREKCRIIHTGKKTEKEDFNEVKISTITFDKRM